MPETCSLLSVESGSSLNCCISLIHVIWDWKKIGKRKTFVWSFEFNFNIFFSKFLKYFLFYFNFRATNLARNLQFSWSWTPSIPTCQLLRGINASSFSNRESRYIVNFLVKLLFLVPIRHPAPESVVDNTRRRDSAQRLRYLQLQSRSQQRSVWRARIIVELQLLLLQQEIEADRILQLSRNQVSNFSDFFLPLLFLKLACARPIDLFMKANSLIRCIFQTRVWIFFKLWLCSWRCHQHK